MALSAMNYLYNIGHQKIERNNLLSNAMNYLLYYKQPTKTTSIKTQLDALYGHS
jgi:hypothetical protein